MKAKLRAIGILILLFFALQPFCKGQTPTCTPSPTETPTPTCTPQRSTGTPAPYCPEPTPSPVPTPIPSAYQPPGKDGMLKWRVLIPTDGKTKWPVCLVIHPGEFYYGNYFDNNVENAARDMALAGYYTLIVNHRLAPPNLICLQDPHDATHPTSGGSAEQTNDIKALIRAARNDSHCYNGQVVAIGGSSGASHAVLGALDTTSAFSWPFWNSTTDDRLQAAVGLSGPYDYADRTQENYTPNPLPNFKYDIENYSNTCKRAKQQAISPIVFVTSNAPPIYIINSEKDTMPHHQILDMQCALQNAGVTNYQVSTIPDSTKHAFHYWDDAINPPNPQTVGAAVIQFLDSHVTHQP